MIREQDATAEKRHIELPILGRLRRSVAQVPDHAISGHTHP